MSYAEDIVVGVAELLEANGVSEWDADAAYAATGGPVTLVQVVPDIARPIVTLTPYLVQAYWEPNDGILGLQVRVRAPGADPRPSLALEAAVSDVLHGIHGNLVGGHRITKVVLQSSAVLGQDENERWSRSSNFYIHGPH